MSGSEDRGEADPALASALAAGGDGEVLAALVDARLLVPVVAARAHGPSDATEMSLVTLVGRDGRTALPAFTSVSSLASWRAEARPVPVSAREAAAGAVAAGHAALVLDPAGPVPFTVDASALADLAAGYVPIAGPAGATLASRVVSVPLELRAPEPAPPPWLPTALGAVLAGERSVTAAYLVDVVYPSAGEAPRLGLGLVLAPGATPALGLLAERLAEAVAAELVLFVVPPDLVVIARSFGVLAKEDS